MRKFRNSLWVIAWCCCLWLGPEFSLAENAETASLNILSGKVVYQGNVDGDWELFALNAGGERLIQLTDNASDDEQPRWSPDGRRIAFTSNRSGNYEIYTMKSDGEDVRRLTHDAFDNKEPSWSPDGRSLLFTSYQKKPSGSSLSLIASDGSRLRRISQISEMPAHPAWSPDGKTFVFSATRYNLPWGLFMFDLENEDCTRLTGSNSTQMAWSPDGARSAYLVTLMKSEDFPIFIRIMNLEGEASKQDLFLHKNHDLLAPVWSPDGQFILYAKNPNRREPNWEIQAVSVEDQKVVDVAKYPLQGTWADWHLGSIPDEVFARKGTPWTLKFLYEAEFSPHTTGNFRHDPDALNRRALLAHSGDKAGFLVHGPYKTFPAGEYSVRFRMKISDSGKGQNPVVQLDTSTNRGKISFARQLVRTSDFLKEDRYQEFELTFFVPEPTELEFRAWYFAQGSLWLDRITLSICLAEL